MTHKRVVAVVSSIWLISVFLPTLTMLWVPLDISSFIILCLGVIGLLTTAVYIRIYLAVRRHKNQIQAQQVQHVAEDGELAKFARLIKSAFNVFYVYLVILVCYFPYFVSLTVFKINVLSIASGKCFLFSLTLVFLNSSLNPVIYCWKMRHIRHAIMNILRNMPWLGNRA